MSHFVVIVAGDNVDLQLAPYAEQDFDSEYGVFEDIEDEELTRYQTGQIDLVSLSDGTVYYARDERFMVAQHACNADYAYPDDAVLRKGGFQELFKTFEEYMETWRGYPARDPQTGRYGFWYNPNAQYDWYVIGGRWTGYFKPKAGALSTLGRPGVFGNKPLDGWADSLRLRDIDIEAMQAIAVADANETYDKIEKILNGRVYPSWADIKAKHTDVNAARAEYVSNEVVSDFRKADIYDLGDFAATYGESRQDYIEKRKSSVMVPYALLIDGEWYQKADLAAEFPENTQAAWNTKFWELLGTLDPDTQLTVVDCHI